MASDLWREDEPLRRTTFEDLQMIVSCSTRLSIAIALSRGSSDVNQLGSLLGFSQPVLSNHLKVLRAAGCVDFERDGGRHIYHLKGTLHVGVDSGGVRIALRAGDGSSLSARIPSDSPVMRHLWPGPFDPPTTLDQDGSPG
ncbi:MAG: winged helix-turn-helix transcriptional regulator [Phycisphaeraceae bacterium]|nr:winged helix-turn-helix transcriptional regulator [Phycisphaeraceae bacterium]